MWRKYMMALLALGLCLGLLGCHGKVSDIQEDWQGFFEQWPIITEPEYRPITEEAEEEEGEGEEVEVEEAVVTDGDGDGFADSEDNCPQIANADQKDLDGDGQGDACDADKDGDEVDNDDDNCPLIANARQEDANGDGVGDACDADNDGKRDDEDNCPAIANKDQFDRDEDGKGDACDNCLFAANADQLDNDGDSIGNKCDRWPDHPSFFAVRKWMENNSEGSNYYRYIEFEYSDEGEIKNVEWKTSFLMTGSTLKCELSSPKFEKVSPGTYSLKVKPICIMRFISANIRSSFVLEVVKAKFIVEDDNYKEVLLKIIWTDLDSGIPSTIEGITQKIGRDEEGRITSRQFILNFPDPELDFKINATYEYDQNVNIGNWMAVDQTRLLLEKRKYTWVNSRLTRERVANINLLFPELNSRNEDCCNDAEVELAFEPGETESGEPDPFVLAAIEREKLYKKGSADDLRYDLKRRTEYVQVKNPPKHFDIFVDMAQPILLMFPKFVPIPPFELL